MRSNILSKLFLFLSAFTLTDSVLLFYLDNAGQSDLSASLSYFLLVITTVLSALIIIKEKKLWRPLLLASVFIIFLEWFQQQHDVFGESSEFSKTFIIHGIGGLIMGLAVNDYIQYIKYLGALSSFYLLFLIAEPINHNLLNIGDMSTGYVMAKLVLFLMLSCFTVYRKSGLFRIFVIQALIMSVLIVLFSSRGCGLTIAVAWLFFYMRERALKGKKVGGSLVTVIIAILVFVLALPSIRKTSFHINGI